MDLLLQHMGLRPVTQVLAQTSTTLGAAPDSRAASNSMRIKLDIGFGIIIQIVLLN
jgi:hypothetical protein